MCNPVAFLVASTAMQTVQARNESAAQANMYNAQAKQAEMNKRISDRNQEQIAEQYLQERKRMDGQMRLIAGKNAAQAGASGLTMEGSPLDVLGAGYSSYQTDVNNWETNKNNDIYSEALRGVNFQNEANSSRAAAANAKQQGNLKMIGTLLSGASSYYNLKAQYATRKTTESSGAKQNSSWNPFKVDNSKSGGNSFNMGGKKP